MTERETFARQKGLMLIEAGIVLIIVVLLVLFVWTFVTEQRQWEAFAAAHNCKVVGRMDGDTYTVVGPVVGSNGGAGVGAGLTSSPTKTAYLCDDGVTYWKSQ